MSKARVKKFTAWAVRLENGGFAGRFYFWPMNPLPKQLAGCQIALFDTRQEARDAERPCLYTAGVARVEVTIREQPT